MARLLSVIVDLSTAQFLAHDALNVVVDDEIQFLVGETAPILDKACSIPVWIDCIPVQWIKPLVCDLTRLYRLQVQNQNRYLWKFRVFWLTRLDTFCVSNPSCPSKPACLPNHLNSLPVDPTAEKPFRRSSGHPCQTGQTRQAPGWWEMDQMAWTGMDEQEADSGRDCCDRQMTPPGPIGLFNFCSTWKCRMGFLSGLGDLTSLLEMLVWQGSRR